MTWPEEHRTGLQSWTNARGHDGHIDMWFGANVVRIPRIVDVIRGDGCTARRDDVMWLSSGWCYNHWSGMMMMQKGRYRWHDNRMMMMYNGCWCGRGGSMEARHSGANMMHMMLVLRHLGIGDLMPRLLKSVVWIGSCAQRYIVR